MSGAGLHDFFGFLMRGLDVVLSALENIEFTIQTNSFNLVDFIGYSCFLTAALRFISTRYQGTWRGDHKQINRKVNR